MDRSIPEKNYTKEISGYQLLVDGKNMTGEDWCRDLVNRPGSREAASKALNEAGIKEIRYNGDGKCAVVFDDQAIEILEA